MCGCLLDSLSCCKFYGFEKTYFLFSSKRENKQNDLGGADLCEEDEGDPLVVLDASLVLDLVRFRDVVLVGQRHEVRVVHPAQTVRELRPRTVEVRGNPAVDRISEDVLPGSDYHGKGNLQEYTQLYIHVTLICADDGRRSNQDGDGDAAVEAVHEVVVETRLLLLGSGDRQDVAHHHNVTMTSPNQSRY